MIKDMTKKQAIKLFEEKKVRTIWDDEQEKWYFSIVDVCGVLTDSKDATTYWRKLKQRLKAEGNETVTNCHALKLLAADGKMRLTDVADIEQLFRLIQSIPSPKAEPFKQWMAQAEASTTELSKQRNPKGYKQQTKVAKEGGSVAKAARNQLESKLGRSVISEAKASDYLLPNNEEEEK